MGRVFDKNTYLYFFVIKRTISFAWIVKLQVIEGLAYGELRNRNQFVLLKIKAYSYYEKRLIINY